MQSFVRNVGQNNQKLLLRNKRVQLLIQLPMDGILLSDLPKGQLPTDGRTNSFSPNFTNEKPISSSFSSPIIVTEEKGLIWAVKTCFRKYVTFNGRASRSEYWFFCLFNCIISSILFGLAIAINQESVSLLFFRFGVRIYTCGILARFSCHHSQAARYREKWMALLCDFHPVHRSFYSIVFPL